MIIFIRAFITFMFVSFVFILPAIQPIRSQTNCPLKSQGDADCDGVINLIDYEVWRREYSGSATTADADFSFDGIVNLIDYEIWRRAFSGGPITVSPSGKSPTPTRSPTSLPSVPPSGSTNGIWISAQELSNKPMSGTAWNNVFSSANSSCGTPDILNQDDTADVCYLAKGLVYGRTASENLRTDVRNAIKKVVTITGGTTYVNLAGICRNLLAYIIAADLVSLPPDEDQVFRSYLREVRTRVIDGKSVVQQSEDRPNNIGTHCTATRLASGVYLGDQTEIQRVATVFKGWLGNRSSYAGFSYGDLSWQCDSSKPVGINPTGCTKSGHNIDGVLPDDQRRGGGFTWPPPKENYVWEALQGAHATATILSRRGYDVWNWENKAMYRAVKWLHEQANFPASGDDTWQPHLTNYFYGANFPAPIPSNPGKNLGWTDWTHAR